MRFCISSWVNLVIPQCYVVYFKSVILYMINLKHFICQFKKLRWETIFWQIILYLPTIHPTTCNNKKWFWLSFAQFVYQMTENSLNQSSFSFLISLCFCALYSLLQSSEFHRHFLCLYLMTLSILGYHPECHSPFTFYVSYSLAVAVSQALFIIDYLDIFKEYRLFSIKIVSLLAFVLFSSWLDWIYMLLGGRLHNWSAVFISLCHGYILSPWYMTVDSNLNWAEVLGSFSAINLFCSSVPYCAFWEISKCTCS